MSQRRKFPMPAPECSEMCCVRQAPSMTTLTSARLTQSSEGFQARLSFINPLWSMTYCYFLKMKNGHRETGIIRISKWRNGKVNAGYPFCHPAYSLWMGQPPSRLSGSFILGDTFWKKAETSDLFLLFLFCF